MKQPFIKRAGSDNQSPDFAQAPASFSKPSRVSQTEQTITTLQSRLDSQENKTGQAIKFRRYQRWIFYALGAVLFLSMIAFLIKVYSDNTALVADLDNLNTQLSQRQQQISSLEADLSSQQQDLLNTNVSLQDAMDELSQTSTELDTALTELATVKSSQDELDENNQTMAQKLDRAEANLSNLISRLGISITLSDLFKIPFPEAEFTGVDIDKDGLPDIMEKIEGTDRLKADSDNDGYDDKSELVSGFDPTGTEPLPINQELADSFKGKIILVKDNDETYAWFVAADGKRYWLGVLSDHFSAMRDNAYWGADKANN